MTSTACVSSDQTRHSSIQNPVAREHFRSTIKILTLSKGDHGRAVDQAQGSLWFTGTDPLVTPSQHSHKQYYSRVGP